jgi:hypothetical protein
VKALGLDVAGTDLELRIETERARIKQRTCWSTYLSFVMFASSAVTWKIWPCFRRLELIK